MLFLMLLFALDALAVLRAGRHYSVARDWSGLGAMRDLVKARSWGGEFRAAIERWLKAHPGVLS